MGLTSPRFTVVRAAGVPRRSYREWNSLQPEEFERASRASRISVWLPMLLVFGGFSLSWVPSHSALLNAVLVGLYLSYAATVTGLYLLPWLSAKLR